MGFHYSFGGLQLGSSVSLGQLRALDRNPSAEGEIRLFVEEGRPPEPDRTLFRWGGRYGLSLGKSGEHWLIGSSLDGTFLIDVIQRTIRCFVVRPDEPAWLDVLVRRVLPRVAILFGATAIHAAAAARDGGAVLLLGESGAGKSTLSASLGNCGWDILSDDISLLWNPGEPMVSPATTGVCVWADSRAGLNLSEASCLAMPGYEGKVRFVSGGDERILPAPLRAFVFLARSADIAEPALEPMAATEGLILAARQRIRFNPADASGAETRGNFERLGAILRVTPCYRLHYPAGYEALPRVGNMLEKALGA